MSSLDIQDELIECLSFVVELAPHCIRYVINYDHNYIILYNDHYNSSHYYYYYYQDWHFIT